MSAIDEILVSLQRLADPASVARAVAKRAETTVQAAIAGAVADGHAPDGAAWAPTKSGGRAYANAASAVETKAYGELVTSTLSGPEVYGHFGNSHLPQRRMLPDAGAAMPPSIEKALEKAAGDVFEEWTR
jgi:hypothetical protein